MSIVTRKVVRLLDNMATGLLVVAWVVGAAAGGVTVAALALGRAARLGFTDVKKRGGHGPG